MVVTLLRRPLVWAAGASYALMVVCFVLAARRTTAANAIFIQYTGPIYVAVLGGPMLGEKLRRTDLFAVAGCIVGMALAFGGELGGGRAAGNVLALFSSFGFAGLPCCCGSIKSDCSPRRATTPALARPLTRRSWRCRSATRSPRWWRARDARASRDRRAALRTYAVLVALGFFQIGLPVRALRDRRAQAARARELAHRDDRARAEPGMGGARDGRDAERARDVGGAIIVSLAVAAQGVAAARRA